MSPTEYQKRLSTILKLSTIREITAKLVIQEESKIKILKEQDFLEGDILGDGKKYTYRSKAYSDLKKKRNPLAGGFVDLIDTGSFVEKMYLLTPKSGKFKFGSRDSKTPTLREKYGEMIFGLNQQAFNKFQKDFIQKRLIKELKNVAKIS